jgi:hypothetical protein
MPCSECIYNVKVDYLGTIIVIEHSCAVRMIAASGEPECLMLSRDASGGPAVARLHVLTGSQYKSIYYIIKTQDN